MKTSSAKSALLGGLLGAVLSSQAATIDVRFVEPDKFRDVGESARDREQTMTELEAYMRKLAAKLPASQSLAIEVSDVDLAGQIEPQGRMMERLRVVRAITWPRMELHYVLSEGGKTLREGKASLSDMNYLSGISRPANTEPMRYEKQLLSDWFSSEFEGKQR